MESRSYPRTVTLKSVKLKLDSSIPSNQVFGLIDEDTELSGRCRQENKIALIAGL